MERWRNKVAVVTGASGELGSAIATRLVEEGLQVVGLSRRSERVKALSKELADKKGKLHAIRVDVTRESNILEAFKWITENLGPVHILINCVGIIQDTTLIEGSTEKWKRVLETNILAVCIATREAITIMRKYDIDGHVVHINSLAGHVMPSLPNMNVFPASKYAVTALTESLRRELNSFGLKIKISSISPGIVSSEAALAVRNKSVNREVVEILKTMPSLEATDVADAVLYVLATPPHVQVLELMIRPVGDPFK